MDTSANQIISEGFPLSVKWWSSDYPAASSFSLPPFLPFGLDKDEIMGKCLVNCKIQHKCDALLGTVQNLGDTEYKS